MPKAKKKGSDTVLKRLASIEKNQKELMNLQKKILKKTEIIQAEEEQELVLEREDLASDKLVQKEELQEIEELKKLEDLERSIQNEVKVSPLKRITQRDIVKGVLGAFVGIVGHFAFAKGVELAEHYSYTRSILLLATSFVIIVLFLYFAGFRKVDDTFVFKILPVRALVIYFSALITILVVLLLYGKIGFSTPFNVIFNNVAAISILAVLGAGTADLIGKTGE